MAAAAGRIAYDRGKEWTEVLKADERTEARIPGFPEQVQKSIFDWGHCHL